MGAVAAPAESPPAPARAVLGTCGAPPASPGHSRRPGPIRFADAHGAPRGEVARAPHVDALRRATYVSVLARAGFPGSFGGRLGGRGHLDAGGGWLELAGSDLHAAARDRDGRVLAARGFDQAGAFERAEQVEGG